MNLVNRTIFKSMKTAIETCMETTKNIFAEYKAEMNKEKAVSKKFVDADGYYAEKQQIAAEKARNKLISANKELRTSLAADAHSMKKSMETYLAEPMNSNFVTKLKVYADFNIPMTRTEINSLLALNAKNPVGLRALKHVIERTHTPWELKFQDIGALEEDVWKVERLSKHALYTPLEYGVEAMEIFKGERMISVREDGSTYEDGRTYDSISLMIERQTVSIFLDDIEKMEKVWIADIDTPDISRASKQEAKYQNEVNDDLRKAGIDEKYLDEIDTDPESTTSVESDPAARLIAELQSGKDIKGYRDAVGAYMK